MLENLKKAMDELRRKLNDSSSHSSSVTIINGNVVSGNIVNGDMVIGGRGHLNTDTGIIEVQARPVPQFTKVSSRVSADIEWQPSDTPSCKITADQSVLDKIEVKIEGGAIEITTNGSFATNKPITIVLKSKTLSDITVSGSGSFNAESLVSDELSATVSGSGSLTIEGQAKELNAKVSGSGDLDASDFDVNKLIAKVSGSGDLRAYATGEADATVSGSGDIKISGNPPHQRQKISGSGSIKFKKKSGPNI